MHRGRSPEEPKELREDTILGMRLTVIDDQLRNDLQLDDEAQGLVILDISGTSEAFEKGRSARRYYRYDFGYCR